MLEVREEIEAGPLRVRVTTHLCGNPNCAMVIVTMGHPIEDRWHMLGEFPEDLVDGRLEDVAGPACSEDMSARLVAGLGVRWDELTPEILAAQDLIWISPPAWLVKGFKARDANTLRRLRQVLVAAPGAPGTPGDVIRAIRCMDAAWCLN